VNIKIFILEFVFCHWKYFVRHDCFVFSFLSFSFSRQSSASSIVVTEPFHPSSFFAEKLLSATITANRPSIAEPTFSRATALKSSIIL
jgi:hypothetical protein